MKRIYERKKKNQESLYYGNVQKMAHSHAG